MSSLWLKGRASAGEGSGEGAETLFETKQQQKAQNNCRLLQRKDNFLFGHFVSLTTRPFTRSFSARDVSSKKQVASINEK